MSPTYSEYLRLEELLKLQTGIKYDKRKISNDELHFILVHQNFELWFKLIINELKCTRDILSSAYVEETKLPQAVHHMARVIETFKLMAQQWKVMETLEPQDFLNFRDELGTASGFESFQMREMESLMGKKWIDGKPAGKDDDSTKSLYEVTCEWLERTPIQGSTPKSKNDEENVNNFINNYLKAHKAVYPDTNQEAIDFFDEDPSLRRRRAGLIFIESYRDLPLLAWPRKLISTLIELEESMILWRSSHARMVERMIGRRIGTGGSSGVDYLDMTTKYRVFIESYRELPLLAWPRKLISTLIELEESMILWRSAHARMVERMIGRRIGTGGSSGVDYLDMTTKYRVFIDLWSVRSVLIKKEALPPLQNPDFYEFKGE